MYVHPLQVIVLLCTLLLLLLFSCSVVSWSLQPHWLQHTRLSCPSLSSKVCSNPCPLSWWCHPTISSSDAPFSFCPQSFPAPLLKLMSIESMMPSNHLILWCPLLLLSSIFPSIRVFSNESILHILWPKYWSFSISTLATSMRRVDSLEKTLMLGGIGGRRRRGRQRMR